MEKLYISLALYNYWADVYRKAPPQLDKFLEYVAHVKYSFGGNSRGIDIFHFNKLPLEYKISEFIDIKRTIKLGYSRLLTYRPTQVD